MNLKLSTNILSVLSFVWLMSLGSFVLAEETFQVPSLTSSVVDEAGLLNRGHQYELEQLLEEFYKSGKGQIQIVTLESLHGLSIEEASIKIADQWKIGDPKKDDGIILIVAKQERKIRIEVGQGMEGVITDALSSRIIREIISPAFKQGSIALGLKLGVKALISTITGEAPTDNEGLQDDKKAHRRKGFPLDLILFFIFIPIILILNIFNRHGRGGGYYGGGGWGGGGFGGGGSGGGSWGGGGGGFSGGGSSGDW